MAPDTDRPLRARTLAEATLYLRVRGAEVLSSRPATVQGQPRVAFRVRHHGRERELVFRLDRIDPEDPLHLGSGAPSELLDPADLVLFASRVEREMPDRLDGIDRSTLRRLHRDLDLAAEALHEATRFIPRRSEGVPRAAMITAAGRWLYDRDPERFSRERLVSAAQRLRRRTIWYQEVLRLTTSGESGGPS